jgi:hypothetical protein
LVDELEELGHIGMSRDIQVSKSWTISQNLSESITIIREEVSSSYTNFVKVRKGVESFSNGTSLGGEGYAYVF